MMDHRPDRGLRSMSVLTICGLDRLWSGPVTVFFRFHNWTSKHYASRRIRSSSVGTANVYWKAGDVFRSHVVVQYITVSSSGVATWMKNLF